MSNVLFGITGENGTEILSRLKRDLIPTMKSGIMFWPMCDFITFRFIPVHLQVGKNSHFSSSWPHLLFPTLFGFDIEE